ncbi:MAG: hypothetical protein WA131_08125 [Desulfitobacteriaceae bacterium]
MQNKCGMTKVRILEQKTVNGIPVYLGIGVNPGNSPYQFFVAWGEIVLSSGVISTFNSDTSEDGQIWFIDEEEAELMYVNYKAN